MRPSYPIAILLLLPAFLVGCGGRPQTGMQAPHETGATAEPAATKEKSVDPFKLTEDEWRQKLTAEQYDVLREKGTERPFTGKYVDTKTKGIYHCAGCGLALFASDAKFDSGCGWPSFFEPLEGAKLTETHDGSLGMQRTEITCRRCGGHLGHVFNDGPAPTGLRYCINSVSIDQKVREEK